MTGEENLRANMPIYDSVAMIPPKPGFFIISDSHAENLNLPPNYQVGVKFRNEVKIYYQIPSKEVIELIGLNLQHAKEAVLNIAAQLISNNIVGAATMLKDPLIEMQEAWKDFQFERINQLKVSMGPWLKQLAVAGGLTNQIKEASRISGGAKEICQEWSDQIKLTQEIIELKKQIARLEQTVAEIEPIVNWVNQLRLNIDQYFEEIEAASGLPFIKEDIKQKINNLYTNCLDLIDWIGRFYTEHHPQPKIMDE